MNTQMHPLIKQDFVKWVGAQNAAYVIQEAAILFESKFDDLFDFIISVSASKDERILRVITRDKSDIEDVKSRMDMQWSDEDRNAKSDAVVLNDNKNQVLSQVLQIHQNLLSKSG